ncbi:hypothetical protein [Stenotrophomonas sp. PS02289]|uniref:hypothetical protein n=1 Tax=Stenotrophomonas sp. PS02289 TaxID=2991422 RepID=UPI00249AA620|nr:hypothetical protein [Stenotrophomonas sp. PS02289]
MTGSDRSDRTHEDEQRQLLRSALDEFVANPGASLDIAGRIEVLLDDLYPSDDYLQETVEMLACYRPEEAERTIGWAVMRSRLIGVKRHLDTQDEKSKVQLHDRENNPHGGAVK